MITTFTFKKETAMRRIVIMLAAALCMSTAIPSYAEMTSHQKNECLLASRNCADAVDDIQTQIRRLNAEIQKGTGTYTPEEIAKLQGKLSDVKALLDNMVNRQ
jgi:hypothetical protein